MLAVFSTLLVTKGRVEFFPLHMERLQEHATRRGLAFTPHTEEEIKELVPKKGSHRLKIIATDGEKQVIVTPYEEKKRDECTVGLYPKAISDSLGQIKTLPYTHREIIHSFAKKEGFDEVVTVDEIGNLLEAAFANICFVEGSILYYPSPALSLLHGITLQMVCKAALSIGYETKRVIISPSHIPKSAAIFLTSSLKGLLPVSNYLKQIVQRNRAFEKRMEIALEALRISHSLFL